MEESYDKTTPKNSYEQQQGLGAEIAMNMDNPMPIWSGIITKAHIKLLQNGGIPQAKMNKFIRLLRETLREHSRTLWKHRCTTLENSGKKQQKITTQEAKEFAKKLKIEKIMTIESIKNMTNKERKTIFNKIPHILDNKQQTEIWDYFANQSQEHENRYHKYTALPQNLPSTPTPKQTYLDATISITKEKPEQKIQKIIKRKKLRKETQLLKITDAWKPTHSKKENRKIQKQKRRKIATNREYKGTHDDVCNKCNKGGELILCYTCSRCYHWECDTNMPQHIHNTNVTYICPDCTREMKIITKTKNEEKETHKWYTIHQEMSIKEIATIMNTTATDYLYFMRQFHPWGTAGHKKEITHQTDIL